MHVAPISDRILGDFRTTHSLLLFPDHSSTFRSNSLVIRHPLRNHLLHTFGCRDSLLREGHFDWLHWLKCSVWAKNESSGKSGWGAWGFRILLWRLWGLCGRQVKTLRRLQLMCGTFWPPLQVDEQLCGSEELLRVPDSDLCCLCTFNLLHSSSLLH